MAALSEVERVLFAIRPGGTLDIISIARFTNFGRIGPERQEQSIRSNDWYLPAFGATANTGVELSISVPG
jgi:hypothetical protein